MGTSRVSRFLLSVESNASEFALCRFLLNVEAQTSNVKLARMLLNVEVSEEPDVWPFWFVDTKIAIPTEFKIERYKLSKSGRVSSGTMNMKNVDKKRKFYFKYACISGADMDIINSYVDGNEEFFVFRWMENNIQFDTYVYAGAITAKKYRVGEEWYWKDVSFDLIEQ